MIIEYIDFILHLNTHMLSLVQSLGPWIYVVLFLIIFCETGVIFTPFLPGESMLFALGTLAAVGALDLHGMVVLLITAAILGGFVNYFLGLYFGKRLLASKYGQVSEKYMQKTHEFYQRHGSFTIVIARLVPFLRTYAPFVAGVGRMQWHIYSFYNILGAVLWIAGFIYLSYFFGNIPLVQQYFSLVIIGIILLSVVPVAITVLKHVRSK